MCLTLLKAGPTWPSIAMPQIGHLVRLRSAWAVVLVLLLLATPFRLRVASAGEPPRSPSVSKDGLGKRAETTLDRAKLVDALASRNAAPSIQPNGGLYRLPGFPKNYDWADQDRVVGAIQRLVHDAEGVWPEIVGHLDDKRYSITYELFDKATNLSVGDMCKWIISDYLSQAYFWHIPSKGARPFWGFYMPDVARHGNTALKAWCEARSQKRLYELQIEVCEWAIVEARRKDGPLSELSDERRRAVVAGIKGQVAELRDSKRAVKVDRFGARGAEAWGLYTRDRVESAGAKPPAQD